jgi:transcriptional regulator with XRE-family HTH domain/tetratricopeptide (TPR) repeat protein
VSDHAATAPLPADAWNDAHMRRAWRTGDFRAVFHLAGRLGLTPEVIARTTGLPVGLVLDVMKGNTTVNSNSGVVESVATGFGMPDDFRRSVGVVPRAPSPVPVPARQPREDKPRAPDRQQSDDGKKRPHVGVRIAALRRERGLTQESLAERAGISNETVRKIERQLRSPSLSMMETLADALSVPVAELVDSPANRVRAGRLPDYLSADLLNEPGFIQACGKRDLGAIFRFAVSAGFTVSHLARRCEMSVSQVSDYMHRGRPAQKVEIFGRVSDGLHISGHMLGLGNRPWERSREDEASIIPARRAILVSPSSSANLGAPTAINEWPVWFGVRVAHLIGLVDNWREASTHLGSLQTLLDREILMFDATEPDGQSSQALHAFSRRQALVTLAALPLALATSSAISVGTLSPTAATDFFLSRCAASLTACWHLLRGSDLSTVDQSLSSYLIALEGVAQQESKHQKAAARLASQAHRICGIVALHRNQLRVREHHCKQALYYAAIASDASSQASALISLASTYFYDANPAQAAEVYEQASGLKADMSVLQQSRVYAELSVVYGQLGREAEAIRATGLAEELYPDHPEQDRSFLYAEFTPASLSLENGLAYAALAEQYPGRGYQNKAAQIFSRVDQMSSAVPDRIRFEVINHQARTAVLLGDLDAFEIYMQRGFEGVVLLSSEQRRREIQVALQYARDAWPREKRIKALNDGAHLAKERDDSGVSD